MSWTNVASLAVAVIALIGTVLTLFSQRRRDDDANLNARDARAWTRQDERVTELEEQVVVWQEYSGWQDEVFRINGDYVYTLREHIAERKGPPPPGWPTYPPRPKRGDKS